mmetsp:Transcript_3096/g.4998  ORF Transcript_3096/g.4998 Transcript_3096/m.4998 type:complete len:256 (+) Transcript_3096:44-811(+)|eukprot:CAMPEP_0184300346 /NCGR_PEP_ID=MMETSP1049-20130417/10758_1 /TAXON_ID=77928 /ORGANISM="Proteomonas sulcata, Strain CCMP704" /LENGTH=255 /DNA_ID=CAMNT_0026611039 /DNA_START=35 /DNA_END=802 /DNA_ORIENTATION=+
MIRHGASRASSLLLRGARKAATQPLGLVGNRSMGMLAKPALISQIDSKAAAQPHANALKMTIDGNEAVLMTFKQLQRQVEAFGNGLLDVGFRSGDKLVIWAKDCAENVVSQLGGARAGLTVVCLDSSASEADLAAALDGAKGLVFSPTLLPEEGTTAMLHKLIPELDTHTESAQVIEAGAFPSLRYIITTGFERKTGMAKFEHLLFYQTNPTNVSKASVGDVTYAGPGSATELQLPLIDESVTLTTEVEFDSNSQ